MNWTQIFRENLNCYALSIFRVFILLASSDSDKHNHVNEAKSVNKDSPIWGSWLSCQVLPAIGAVSWSWLPIVEAPGYLVTQPSLCNVVVDNN